MENPACQMSYNRCHGHGWKRADEINRTGAGLSVKTVYLWYLGIGFVLLFLFLPFRERSRRVKPAAFISSKSERSVS